MKITASKGELVLNKPPENAFSYFQSKRYRRWNRVLAAITCILIMLLFLAMIAKIIDENVVTNRRPKVNNTLCSCPETTTSTGTTNYEVIEISFCNINVCNLRCQIINDNYQTMEAVLNNERFREFCNNNTTVEITNSAIQVLNKNWIQTHDTSLQIKRITFSNSKIDQIESETFSNTIFKSLETITLCCGTEIQLIRKNAFKTFHLKELNFYDVHLHRVEQQFSDSFATLERFQYSSHHLNSELFLNMTYNITYPKLLRIDLRYCNFDYLTLRMFENMPNVREILIANGTINSIAYGTFAFNHNLEKLVLENSSLVTLVNIFGANYSFDRLKYFNIDENLWYCNDVLRWLKHVWLQTGAIGEPKCHRPKHLEFMKFINVEF